MRVAFWSGEELGLYGSAAYVRTLDAAAITAIRAYLNFDMLGSPNGFRAVYDPTGTVRAQPGTTVPSPASRIPPGRTPASRRHRSPAIR